MKRKFLSIILTAIVLAEAIAVMIVPISAADWKWQTDGKYMVESYNAPIVKSGSIAVDAILDEEYLKGTKITSYPDESPYRRKGYESIWSDVRGEFEAYVALDTKGMYIYAEIEDITIHSSTNDDGNDGDFFQIYFDWCTPDIVHPTPAEMYSMYNSGSAFNGKSYSRTYNLQGLQYIGYLSADYYGKIAAYGGFAPYNQLGPNATDSVGYKAKFIDGGWACEWFIPWRDQEQKDMIANGQQFPLGIGLQVGDDTDINNIKSGEKDVGICYDQRKELGLTYWDDYTTLSDIVFITEPECTHVWTDGEILKAPTCTVIGQREKVCSLCGDTKTVAIPAAGHTAQYIVCTVAKKRDRVCLTCGVTIAKGLSASVSATTPESHVFAPSEENKTPTCTENGAYSVQCKYCSKIEATDSIPALGHSYSDSAEKGKYFCDVCSAKAPLGDTNNDGCVTNSDVLEIFRYIYNSDAYPIEHLELGDVNADGEITNSDVLAIFRYIYNPSLYPLEEEEQTLLIDGFDIHTFKIIYPAANVNGEKELAEKLAKHFKDSFGVDLTVSTTWDGKGSAIVIGENSSYITDAYKSRVSEKMDMRNASLVYAETILWVAANNSYTAKAAVDKLIELTTPDKDESIIISFATAVTVTVSDFGEELKLMSYNVQTGTPDSDRVRNMIKNIVDFTPDVLGTQELNHKWIQHLRSQGILDEYTLVGKPRNADESDTSNGNEYSAILFRTSKFNLIEDGTFWLSDTPTVAGTKHSSSTYIRIMTYAVLERKSDGKRFVHVNTHLSWDENGYKTNLIQINIMLNLLETKIYSKFGELPTFFTGDFNVYESSEGYARMISWGTEDSRHVAESTVTYPTFSGGSIIDFCFVSKGDFLVRKFDVGYGLSGSDHYPVYINTYLN